MCPLHSAFASLLRAARKHDIGLTGAPTQALAHSAAQERWGNLHSRIWEGHTLPEEQAAPEETAMPSRSKAMTAVSAFMPSTANNVVFGRRPAASPKITACGEIVLRPGSNRLRNARMCTASAAK